MSYRHVYLISEEGLYKIGSSASPSARLHQVAPGGTLLHSFPSVMAYAVETALHRRFDRKREGQKGREWFRLDPEEVASIRSVGATDSPDDLPEGLRPLPRHRAPRPDRHASVKIDKELLRKARVIAAIRGIDLFDYLSAIFRGRVAEDYHRLVREPTD